MEKVNEKPITLKSRKKVNLKKLNGLLNDDNVLSETPVLENNNVVTEDSYYYKNKLSIYVLSGQIKNLYGKIITENELNKLTEQERENIYQSCELKTAKKFRILLLMELLLLYIPTTVTI